MRVLNYMNGVLKKKSFTARPPRDNLIWNGNKSLLGKKFLVYEEQGLGDVIQFCRYLPLLKQKGAEVTFKVQKKCMFFCKH